MYFFFFSTGYSARILSNGRTINIGPQDLKDMTLDCKVEYTGSESLFHNQIYWFKVQNLTILETFTSDEIIKNKINDQDTTISQELQKAIDATEEASFQ